MKNTEVFEQKYERLNTEQKLAVDTIEGPVMVVAGPGTGKTTILTLRIANILLQTDTPPSGILALTFTDAGVKVMRNKLREIIGSRADEVRIHTFHGFAASVISEFDDHFPHIARVSQITDVEAEVFMRAILENKKFSKLRPLGDPDLYIGKIFSAMSECKKEAWSPEYVKNFARAEIERIQKDPDALSTRGATKGQIKADFLKRIERCERTILFADVYSAYQAKKKEERKIDFDDLIFELLHALEHDELLLRLLQEKFLYILVDEHQDTNDSQNLIVSHLANFFDTPNIFVVGDEKQAIYRFQGASVENFLKFQKMWKQMKTISLTDNYRSHQSILDATFGMIEKNYDQDEHKNLRIQLRSKSSNTQKPIECVSAGNNESADEFLIERLQEIVAKEPEAKTAIIVRRNRDVEYLLSLCNSVGLPASAERGADIFSHSLGILYFDLLQYLIDPTYIQGLTDTLSVGLWNIDFQTSVELIGALRSGQYGNIQKEIPALVRLQSEITRLGVIEYLIVVAESSGLAGRFAQSPVSAEVWRNIISLARDIAQRSNISDSRLLIEELLAYKRSAEIKSIQIGSGSTDAPITIMTAHGSKGLEYDYVFLPCANEESWMHRFKTPSFVLPREKDESGEVKDSRRLFYVALTRARKHAVIISSQMDMSGRILVPLRFIDELDTNHIIQKNLPAKDVSVRSLSFEKINSDRELEMIEYTKQTILEKGLSVTALNHFLECPTTFFYKSILKLPEAPSPSSEKGIAMHKALSLVWKEKNKNVETIQHVIENTISEYFKTSLLPLFEKEVVVAELLENAPQVAVSLVDYFNSTDSVATEKWVETTYTGTYKGKKIDINLHGQLDVILEKDKKVEVFDYKTREVMSVNAIKGETKDADGNYFRQLIFYKLLLENNSRYADKEIEPALIFVKPDSKGRCPTVSLSISEDDVLRVKTEIQSLIDVVWSRNLFSDTCADVDCLWCKLKK
ncbi:MAG: ATP-dependent DNA helicase [bacterium]